MSRRLATVTATSPMRLLARVREAMRTRLATV
jgi:hypothetical protein